MLKTEAIKYSCSAYKKSRILIAAALILIAGIIDAAAGENIYSSSGALKKLFQAYNIEVSIFEIEKAFQTLPPDMDFEDMLVKIARGRGLYLNRFLLKYKEEDFLKITAPFISKYGGDICFITQYKEGVEIDNNRKKILLSNKEFLNSWEGEIISLPIANIALVRKSDLSSASRIIFLYSYHNEDFYAFKKVFDRIYKEAKNEDRLIIYIDELGLIPQSSLQKLIESERITEKEAFLKTKASLIKELKLIEKGIGIYDDTKFYEKIYDYLAGYKIQIEMEDLQYENWKAIVSFDELELNQLSVTLFCRGNVDRYLEILEQYNEGFWQYNVILRDKVFRDQIERIAHANPDAVIFTLRGLGHFGIEEEVDIPGFSTETMIIGEGDFQDLFIPDQLLQVLKRNNVVVTPEYTRSFYLKAFPAECLRSYYQKRLNFSISEATVKANKTAKGLTEDKVRRLSLDLSHGISEGRLRTTDAIYEFVFFKLKRVSFLWQKKAFFKFQI